MLAPTGIVKSVAEEHHRVAESSDAHEAALVQRVAQVLLWPIRRVLDPRFADVNRRLTSTRLEITATQRQLSEVSGEVSTDIDAIVGKYTASSLEATAFIGTQLRELNAHVRNVDEGVQQLRDEISPMAHEAAARHYSERVGKLHGAQLSELDSPAAELLNYAGGHRGFAAQADLWLNPPLHIEYSEGAARLASVNERIVEVPFAMRALARVEPGSRILDFGSSENSIALSLAALGYRVTALDLRKYPFRHPNLEAVASPLEEWEAPEASFDAVLCISTLEHVGLGWYGEQRGDVDADERALRRLGRLMKPGGVLVLTIPYGASEVNETQRRYDKSGLATLLDGWEVLERTVVEKQNELTWSPVDDSTGNAVAMLVVTPRT